ncbi:MAG: hypothetical protein LBJ12_06815 [Oscillospiraceae bacterium]|jgi:hypothetical protein|nr:hypothetical protein [Oscillospiraceae bacterium]
MCDIFEQWDYSKECFPILLYRAEWEQQAGWYDQLAGGICKTPKEAEGHLQEATSYFDEYGSLKKRLKLKKMRTKKGTLNS